MNDALHLVQRHFRSKVLHLVSQLEIIEKPPSNKVRKLSPLWKNQLSIITAILNGDSAVVLKARQIGISTAVVAAFFVLAFLAEDPLHLVILSYKQKSSRELLNKAKLMYQSLPEWIRGIHPAKITADELVFLESGARISAKSAEDKGGLRSFTCSHLLLTEFSLAPRPEELIASGLAALNKGQLIIEGTAQHFGDCLQVEYDKALAGKTGYRAFFMAWHGHGEYQLTDDECVGFEPTQDEQQLAKLYDLTINQVAWYRLQVAKFGISKVKTEYPSSYEEAYSQLPNAFIASEYLESITQLDLASDEIHRLKPPVSNGIYVIGVDISFGTGVHYSSIHLLNARTLELCACYHSNKTPPTNLADIIGRLSTEYNQASVNVETNNKCGGIVLNELQRNRIPLYLIDGKAWLTTLANKPGLLESVRQAIMNHELKILDKFTYNELRNTTINSDGTPNTSQLDSHLDGGISLALAITAAKNVPLPKQSNPRDLFRRGGQQPRADKRVY